MNCEQFERLIALQIEGDLPGSQQFMVSKHLSTCGSCHRFAEEIRDSQTALHGYTGQDFDESLLAEIRHSVMSQIHSGEIALSRWERIAGWFGILDFRHFIWAVSGAAAVLMITASLLVHIFNKAGENVLLNARAPEVAGPVEIRFPSAPPKEPLKNVKYKRPLPRRKSEVVNPNQQLIANSIQIPDVPMFPKAPDSIGTNSIVANAKSEITNLENSDDWEQHPVTTPKNMMRVELRTPKQNIKVILFVEKKASAPPAALLLNLE
jgi:hypothetical protein